MLCFIREHIQIMPVYRIYRLTDSQRPNFRWAPHTSGVAEVKPKDYSEDGEAEGASPYAVWHQLGATEQALHVGDILECPEGELRICKYVGFEEARWVLPELKTGLESLPTAVGPPQVQLG
jgi:hypothetical protein